MVCIAICVLDFRYGSGMPRAPKPGGAIFEPRTFAENRKKFGHTGSRLITGEVQSPHQGAAELQHAMANRIREYLLDENTDLKRFCETNQLPPGLTYERFQRINRGETMMTLTDVMFWAAEIPEFYRLMGKTMFSLVNTDHSDTGHHAAPSPSGRS
jgi:hypothetical protein